MTAEWEIVFWDVGQGDATDIILPDRSHILIDSGPTVQQGNPMPGWFQRMGRPNIRLAVITHSHVDHYGGLIGLCRDDGQRIEKVSMLNDSALRREKQSADLQALFRALHARKMAGVTSLDLIETDQTLYSADGLRLRIVHPRDLSGLSTVPSDVNKTSMIIVLDATTGTSFRPLVVFGGDATLNAIKSSCSGIHPCVLTGPHHGRPQGVPKIKGQVYWRFFRNEMHPQTIFISVGRRNKYDLPDKNYVKGAASSGVKVCCSQLSVKCDQTRAVDVFEGSALIGIDKPADSVQCRGAMRIFACPTGVRFDENQIDYQNTIARILPEAPCKCDSLPPFKAATDRK